MSSLPALEDKGLVNVGDLVAEALAKRRPNARKGRLISVPVRIDLREPRSKRAAEANVMGAIACIHASTKEEVRTRIFEIHVVETTTPMQRLSRLTGGTNARSADIDDIIGFLKECPELAKPYRLVCLNSGYYGLDDLSPRNFVFSYLEDEETGFKGFEARKLERIEKVLYPGDMILTV